MFWSILAFYLKDGNMDIDFYKFCANIFDCFDWISKTLVGDVHGNGNLHVWWRRKYFNEGLSI